MSQPGSLRQTLTIISRQFEGFADSPALEAQLLAAYVLKKPRSWLLAHLEITLENEQVILLNNLAKRRESGEPLPYLLGKWEFFGLEILVRPGVLIPRPETELLVETALAWMRQSIQPVRTIDVGTGSGCIAVALAINNPGALVTASDISWIALRIAQENLLHHHLTHAIQLVQADLLQPFPAGYFDLICANLPYIPSQTLRGLAVYGKEPNLALDGGADGMEIIKRLIHQARQILAASGLMLLEIEARQGLTILQHARATFPESRITLHPDLAGNDRLIQIQT